MFNNRKFQGICQPIITLEELMQWEYPPLCPHSDSPASNSIEISRNYKPRSGQNVLLCHDMKGGYLDDKFADGVNNADSYRFFHWSYVDIFVYFSHCFLTIPPVCWINASHKNNVRILGTFITEWEDGSVICKTLLESEDMFTRIADKMVEIAKYYGFEGWLINVENTIEKEKIPMLRKFVDYLHSEIHKAIPHGLVIWYDSVISSGELKWQDELNDQNRMFYDSCDGIFLNYTWTEEKLESSAQTTNDCNRPFDVFVGIDVFGRNCFGGGGFHTCKALDVVTKHKLSTAIFAPGWVYEKSEGDMKSFNDNEYKFWELLQPYLKSHSIFDLPFFTSFCQGQGQKFYLNGKVIKSLPWTNLSLQQIQPQFLTTETIEVPTDANNTPCMSLKKYFTFETGYYGGGCLEFTGRFWKPEDVLYTCLYDFDDIEVNTCKMSSKKLLISYVVKHLEVNINPLVFLDVVFKQKADDRVFTLRLCCNSEKELTMLQLTPEINQQLVNSNLANVQPPAVTCIPCMNDLTSLQDVLPLPENQEWCFRCYIFEDLNDVILHSINFGMTCSAEESVYPTGHVVHLGQLQISASEKLNIDCMVKDLEVKSAELLQYEDNHSLLEINVSLKWVVENISSDVERFHISFREFSYSDNTRNCSEGLVWKYYGAVPASHRKQHNQAVFTISKVFIDMNEVKCLEFKVEPVAYNGVVNQGSSVTTHYDISIN